VLAWVQEGKDVRLGDWSAREIEILNTWMLLTAKPVVYLVNMSAKVGAGRAPGGGGRGLRRRRVRRWRVVVRGAAARRAAVGAVHAAVTVGAVRRPLHGNLTAHVHTTTAARTRARQDYIRKKNKWLPKIFEWVQEHGSDPIIPFSGAFEQEVCERACVCLATRLV
jgi:hypothetical protein